MLQCQLVKQAGGSACPQQAAKSLGTQQGKGAGRGRSSVLGSRTNSHATSRPSFSQSQVMRGVRWTACPGVSAEQLCRPGNHGLGPARASWQGFTPILCLQLEHTIEFISRELFTEAIQKLQVRVLLVK